MPVVVTIVQHGDTMGTGILHGQINYCLSEKGVRQALNMGTELSSEVFTRVYTSDLARTEKTLQNIVYKLKTFNMATVRFDERLRDRNFGDAQGRPTAEFTARANGNGFQATPYLFTPPAAESYAAFVGRIMSFFNDIVKIADSPKPGVNENILIVTHGSWVTACMRHLRTEWNNYDLYGFDATVSVITPENAGIIRFIVGDAGTGNFDRRLLTFCYVSHMERYSAELTILPLQNNALRTQ